MYRIALAAFLLGLLGLADGTASECQSKLAEQEPSHGFSFMQTLKVSGDSHPEPSPCPYNFEAPKCNDAEVQSPRDLLHGAPGHLVPKATTLNAQQTAFLPLTNVHFHLGAEHRSWAYQDSNASDAYDAKLHPSGPRPGFMCNKSTQFHIPYTFKHCKDHVEVGKTYEIHWVRSSAGSTKKDLDGATIGQIDDGLGGAANGRGLLNPMIAVNVHVVQIVNGKGSGDEVDLKWNDSSLRGRTSVMYPGSTTGTSFNNSVCSPYAITWHVDKDCYKVTAYTFDSFCKELAENGIEEDLNAHGSRILVDPAYVAKPEFVLPLA